MKRPVCQTLSKPCQKYISSATAGVAPDLLKALAILSDTTIRISAVDWQDLKPCWKSEKKDYVSPGDQQSYYLQFSHSITWDIKILGWCPQWGRVSLTSWGEGASLALVGHPSSDGVMIKMPYRVDVLHRPALHPVCSYWVG